MQRGDILICLVEKRDYLNSKPLILLESSHWKRAFEIGAVVFTHINRHFVWIILADLKLAGKTPFILRIFFLMMAYEMAIPVFNLQPQLVVFPLMKDL